MRAEPVSGRLTAPALRIAALALFVVGALSAGLLLFLLVWKLAAGGNAAPPTEAVQLAKAILARDGQSRQTEMKNLRLTSFVNLLDAADAENGITQKWSLCFSALLRRGRGLACTNALSVDIQLRNGKWGDCSNFLNARYF